MGYFKLGKMTLKSLFKRPETIRYPYETKPPVEDLKGHVENDIVECTLCGICAKRCPTGCITVDKELMAAENAEGNAVSATRSIASSAARACVNVRSIVSP